MRDWKTLNAEVIAEFRENGGEVSQLGGRPALILHTIGARSGRLREIPLIPVFEGDDMFIFATAAGAPQHPDWYYNLKAHPRIDIEYGPETFTADVIELPEGDAIRMVSDRAVEIQQLADYVTAAAPRVIPVFSITRA